ncbi:MAG: NAD(P)-binding protein, partial [Microlunatus sp.]|nr:NAD(P)-binding protein [Microlunatus sp.]
MAVVGGGLAGLAAALRLAKARHSVRLYEASDLLGGRWAARRVDLGGRSVVIDDVPPVLEFPAPWRDLFRKSGRTLAEELDRSGAALVPAPPATYVFADGADLSWPTDRGELYAVHERRYGTATAERWRALVDRLDDIWQTVRKLGWEAEMTGRAQLTGPVRRRVLHDHTVADLATEIAHPHLAAVLRASAYRQGSDPETTPAWCAVALSVERRFGRWTVRSYSEADEQDRTGRSSAVVDALIGRLGTRRVDVRLGERVEVLDHRHRRIRGATTNHQRLSTSAVIWTADPRQLSDIGLPRFGARGLRHHLRRLQPARAPSVGHELVPISAERPPDQISEQIALDADGVHRVSYRRPVRAGPLWAIHDWRQSSPEAS